jgi:hypothetical protein
MSGGSEKRDILAGTGIYGGYAVETDLLNILDPLRNELVL